MDVQQSTKPSPQKDDGTAVHTTDAQGMRGQLTLRGIIIGCLGCIIITASSVYTALKMGALPWPIVFAALVSLFFLRLAGSRSLNEANVTHTIMSAGAMVAGGLAFTIPGIWILGAGDVSLLQMLLIALAGTALGLVACTYLRKHFIERQALEFPIGQAAAESLKAGNTGGRTGAQLFTSMGLAGLWAALRDYFGVIPAMVLGEVSIPGIAFGIYLSPMFLAVGFLVGTIAMVAWFGGALLQVLLVSGASALGAWSLETGQTISSSAGMGVMMGCGIAVVVKDVLPRLVDAMTSGNRKASKTGRSFQLRMGLIALVAAGCAYAVCIVLGIGPLASAIVILLSFATAAMSAQSVGQTGIDPMEIFGLIVLLIVALVGNTPQIQLFFVAAIIAVACGLGGDVMNDFKAGNVLGTNPQAQVVGQAIGGVLGALVAAATLFALVQAYGTDAFGVDKLFVAAQANVVATLVGGIPHMEAFIIGLIAGFAIYVAGGPAMMIGLGIYLPFYLSLTAFLGCVAKWIYNAVRKPKGALLDEQKRAEAQALIDQDGLVVASGILGGESIVGVLIALLSTTQLF